MGSEDAIMLGYHCMGSDAVVMLDYYFMDFPSLSPSISSRFRAAILEGFSGEVPRWRSEIGLSAGTSGRIS